MGTTLTSNTFHETKHDYVLSNFPYPCKGNGFCAAETLGTNQTEIRGRKFGLVAQDCRYQYFGKCVKAILFYITIVRNNGNY